MLLGGSGYVGGRLIPLLEWAGVTLRCVARNPEKLRLLVNATMEVVSGDVLDAASLDGAMAGVETVYYLVHLMAGSKDFERQDGQAAQNVAAAAGKAGVRRMVYLGSLGDENAPDLSPHLRSRHEVGDILRASGVETVEFRAGMVVGAGSTSYQLLKSLTDRLPVMICPRWVMTRTQPIAIGDVLDYLVAALDAPGSTGQIVEIGGASIETYRSMMQTYAQIRGLKRWLLRVPVLTPRLSSYWLNLVTPFPAAITRPLIEGLKTEVVCTSDQAARLFPQIVPMGYRAAVEAAVSRTGPDNSVRTMISRSDAHVSLRRQGYICDVRQTRINAPAARVFAVLQGLGGKPGWLYGNLLWQMRGWLDCCVGGVGMSRGRTGGAQMQVGDGVDFWRVEEVVPGEEILLRAEMKLPGRAWLQFILLAESRERTLLRCCAWFEPRGLVGELYWGLLYPIHVLIFRGMARAIARKAESSFQSSAEAFQGS